MSHLINEKAVLPRDLNRGKAACIETTSPLPALTSPLPVLLQSPPATGKRAVVGMMDRTHYKLPRGKAAQQPPLRDEVKMARHAIQKRVHTPDTESSCKGTGS